MRCCWRESFHLAAVGRPISVQFFESGRPWCAFFGVILVVCGLLLVAASCCVLLLPLSALKLPLTSELVSLNLLLLSVAASGQLARSHVYDDH